MHSQYTLKTLCSLSLLSTFLYAGDFDASSPLALVSNQNSDKMERLPQFDIAQIAFLQTGNMNIDSLGGGAELQMSNFQFRTFFVKPIVLPGEITFVPMIGYDMTTLDFSNAPVGDEVLHAISLHGFYYKEISNSPWFAAGWSRVRLATDFQGVDSDALGLDLAAGPGYKFNDEFTIAAGIAMIGINSDLRILPGINFDWKPNDTFQVGLYGPNFLATYTISDTWNLSIRGLPNGGTWVYDNAAGLSRTIDVSSYLLGLYTENNIYGALWLSAGVGYSMANEIEFRKNHGGQSTSRDMDGAPYFQISLGLRKW